MSVQTKEQRLAMIKAAAEKLNAKQNFKKKMAAKSKTAIKKISPEILASKEAKAEALRKYEDFMAKADENYNCWTDGSQYAEQYYGDTYRETTKFDNEWN